MRRAELAQLVASRLGERHVVICALGSTSRAWRELDVALPTFYASDPMGLAPALSLGFALARPDREVLLLEGDGDLAMSLGALVSIAGAAPKNLRIVVFDNGRYETGGGQPVAAAGRCRLGDVAGAAGLNWTQQAPRSAGLGEVAAALDMLLRAPAPGLLCVGVDAESSPYGGAGSQSGVEARVGFQRTLGLLGSTTEDPDA